MSELTDEKNNAAVNKYRPDFYPKLQEVLLLFAGAIFIFCLYSNTLNFPFIFDDGHNIRNNPHIRITGLSMENIIEAGFKSPLSNRPVSNISFALNYYFHQYNVAGYRFVNILIHIVTGIFLYLFLKNTLSIPSLNDANETSKWVPFFTAFIWLVHPIQTQSVTYIVQRMNSMAVMFCVLSLFFYIKARQEKETRRKGLLFFCCIFFGFLALGSKEIAATLPFFVFLYEWYFFQELSMKWLKRHFWLFSGIFVFFALVALLYLGFHPLERILGGYEDRDFNLTQRTLTQCRVVIFYLGLLSLPCPSRLNLDHDFLISHSLINPLTTIVSVILILSLIWLAIYTARRERLLSFCILWFFGNLSIESSVMPLEIVFEHRTYLPSMLAILIVVRMAYRYIGSKWLTTSGLCVVLIVLAVWTYQRNQVWKDDLTLWRDCVEKSPEKARPHYNLALALDDQGRPQEAIFHYYETLRIKPDHAKAHNNLAEVHVHKN